MRLLVDSCVWGGVVEELRAAGHDVDAVRDWSEDPGDAEILARGSEAGRILVTLDKDFGELVFVMGALQCGIMRLVNVRAQDQGRMVLQVLAKHGEELSRGALIVADPRRLRVRLPEGEI